MCVLLIAELILFSFTVKRLIGPGKVYNYLEREYHHPLMRNAYKKMTHLKIILLLFLKLKLVGRPLPPSSFSTKVPLSWTSRWTALAIELICTKNSYKKRMFKERKLYEYFLITSYRIE